MHRTAIATSLTLAIFTAEAPVWADERAHFDIGVRAGITAAGGEPANDIPGAGVYAHYRWNERWTLGFGLDRAEYDYEEPARILGIAQDSSLEPIDTLAESTTASAWLERIFSAPEARTIWFIGSGLGIASVDVPTVTGPREDGGTFDIRTEADNEVIASIMAGVRRRVGKKGFVEFTLRADQHFADWRSTDQVSGASSTVDDYLAYGGYLGLGLRL